MRCAYLPGSGKRCEKDAEVAHVKDGPFCLGHMFCCITGDNIDGGALSTMSKNMKPLDGSYDVSVEWLKQMAGKHEEFIINTLDKIIKVKV